MIFLATVFSTLVVAQSGISSADATVLHHKHTRLQWDSLGSLRKVETAGNTRWIARDIAGRAQAETTLNWLGSVQSARIHHNDGYRRIATNQVSGSKRFLYGRGLDELLFQEKGGAQLSPVVSQLGSTMKLLGANGSVADQFRYDAFGAPLTGDSAGFSHLFAGAIYDSKAKLYDLRHRHYDPQIGRFLSRDPLGMHADGFNLGNAYAYVGNNPLNRRDPLGLLTGDGFLDWLDKKAQWLNQKTWEAAQGVGQGVEMVAAGAWEGLQETKRMFDDVMHFGMPVDSRSAFGKKIDDHKDGGNSLPEAIGLAAVDTVVETAQGLHAAANTFGTAVSNGDVKTATAIATGVGAGIFIPGPDEIVTINALRSAAGANTAARTASRAGEGPGDAKRCEVEMGSMSGDWSSPDSPKDPKKGRANRKGSNTPSSGSGGSGKGGKPRKNSGGPEDEFLKIKRQLFEIEANLNQIIHLMAQYRRDFPGAYEALRRVVIGDFASIARLYEVERILFDFGGTTLDAVKQVKASAKDLLGKVKKAAEL